MKSVFSLFLCFITVLSAQAQVDLNSGLVLRFHQKTLDGLKASKTAELKGTGIQKNRFGVSPGSTSFDGKTSSVTINKELPSGSFSLSLIYLVDSAFMRKLNDSAKVVLISVSCPEQNAFDILINKKSLFFHLGSLQQKPALTAKHKASYHNLTVLYNARKKEYTVFLNGNYEGKVKATSPPNGTSLIIGNVSPSCIPEVPLTTFKGSLDEFRLYNRELNLCEIRALYNTLSDSTAGSYSDLTTQDIDWGFSFDVFEDEELLDLTDVEPARDRFGRDSAAHYFDGKNSHVTISEEADLKFAPKASWTISVFAKPQFNEGTYFYGVGGVAKKQKYKGGAILTRYGCPQVNRASDLIKLRYEPDFISLAVREKNAEEITELLFPVKKEFFDSFHHIMAIRDVSKESITLYIDGRKVAEKELPKEGGMSTSEVAWWVGKDVSCNDGVDHDSYRFFKGVIDEIHIYERALISCEVEELNRKFRTIR